MKNYIFLFYEEETLLNTVKEYEDRINSFLYRRLNAFFYSSRCETPEPIFITSLFLYVILFKKNCILL